MNFVNQEAYLICGEDINFSFGKNWQKFIDTLNEDKISYARLSIISFTGLDCLDGLMFLDLGCGSGLFSLAAYRLGAKQVISMDIDPFSIECVRRLRLREGAPSNWHILQGSALVPPFRKKSFDFVYSWGVLHHTGAMWLAIEKAADLVSIDGYFYIGIYLKRRLAVFWLALKRFYNKSSYPLQQMMVWLYAFFSVLGILCKFQNPVKVIKNYARTSRGMSWIRDIEDWLGGLPYEFATPATVVSFVCDRAFKCVNQKGMEYLFRREG